MRIRFVRQLHLYLGTFFAPMLLMFSVSGYYQASGFHHCKKIVEAEETALLFPYRVLHSLISLHVGPKGQFGEWECGMFNGRGMNRDVDALGSSSFQVFVLLMSVALAFSSISGVVMALQHTRRRSLVILTLLLGCILPWLAAVS